MYPRYNLQSTPGPMAILHRGGASNLETKQKHNEHWKLPNKTSETQSKPGNKLFRVDLYPSLLLESNERVITSVVSANSGHHEDNSQEHKGTKE